MQLHYRKYGTGQPLIILHGLFGSSDNWQTLGKKFAKNFEVLLVDARNHGHSPHSEEWNYPCMREDLKELISFEKLEKPILLGHSMGGKTAMFFAVEYPELLEKLIVVDIAPKAYPVHHDVVLKALQAVDLTKIDSRGDAAAMMEQYIADVSTQQFLLKNLYWKSQEDKQLAWRFNLPVISKNIEEVGKVLPMPEKDLSVLPVLFIRGANSNYITAADMDLAREIFPTAVLETIENAGHWIHAEQPDAFYEVVMDFLK